MKIMGRIFPTEVGRAIERFFPSGDREVKFDPPVPVEREPPNGPSPQGSSEERRLVERRLPVHKHESRYR